ncbi:hypothetical protein DFQ27_002174 [Actinomortierella ambigua]|uniref:GH16 domain-containing protein n=1 Tax=Actinomortierella ambigua TaxID=1343610 RepID=A0A9P6QLL4_9FUNG|nr:hypothetical protein DFQ27_002174 [Actinomortierella ambigua]
MAVFQFYQLVAFALATLLVSLNVAVGARYGTGPAIMSIDDHNDFIVAQGFPAPGRGCQYTSKQVLDNPGNGAGSKITIAKGGPGGIPYSCGELIWKREKLTYGKYSVDMKTPPNAVGHVTAFFLIANGKTEIDVELTGLYPKRAWFNIWKGSKQSPKPYELGFSTSSGWHNYAFDWRPSSVAFFVDGKMVMNRTDVSTTPPSQTNYRLALNAWTQVNQEGGPGWAGRFKWPSNGQAPEAHFRNMNPIDIALAEQGFILSDQYPKGIGPVRLSVDNLYNLLVSPNSSYGHDYYVGTGAAFLSMDNPANGFTLADNSKAPGGGCQYSRHQVRVGGFGQRHGEGTTIALGRRRRKEESDEVVGIPLDTPFTNATAATISHLNQNDNAPFACGELFWKRERATYGRYSADIRTPVGKAIGHVTGFYLRSRNGETELDIELTGLRKDRVWLNVWTADKQHPVNVTVPFSTSDNWHNYAIEWRAMWVAFYIDDRLMLNRTDLQTVPPDQANYRVAFNAWPQMVFDPTWAGNFKWPEDGHGPETHFRNFRYVP